MLDCASHPYTTGVREDPLLPLLGYDVFSYLSQPLSASAQDKSFLSAGSTSHFFKQPQRAGKTRSDTTCASAAALRKPPASCAARETASPAYGN